MSAISNLKFRISNSQLPVAGVALMSGLLAVVLFSGCADVSEAGAGIAQATGVISSDQAQSITRGAQAVEKSWQDLTPEQEYYIGRAVVAQVLQSYAPLDRPQANDYLNLLGQSLAVFSSRPETFGGYHFLLLDSDEINAFAAPGGLILVTRGMVRCCQSEDELAAVLAHEICHVEQKHGLSAIKQGRLTEAFTIVAAESAKQERSADAAAVALLQRAGYPEAAMITMLERMDERLSDAGGLGFAKTHPSAKSRADALRATISATDSASDPVRQQRFSAAMQPIVASK
jgi:predicted Zn-dependent protease